MSSISKDSKRKSRWSDKPPPSQAEDTSKKNEDSKRLKTDEDNDLNLASERPGLGFASSTSSAGSSSKTPRFVSASSSASTSAASSSSQPASLSSPSASFSEQMKLAAERAKKIAEQLSNSASSSPSTSSSSSKNSNNMNRYASSEKKVFDAIQSKMVCPLSEMTAEQQRQYVEQKELQEIYEMMTNKRNQLKEMASKVKFKHEYDSDEECDEEGTWEHKMRRAELEATKEWALKLTEMATGKHHIGDFLPPEEMKKFMETYHALKEGRTPDHSDYKEFKINAENIGFKMLQKFGWQEGQGLGKANQGITVPVNKGKSTLDTAGLGVDDGTQLKKEDDQFDMYRKRMMLAYKFRPNPLNNPRRPYY